MFFMRPLNGLSPPRFRVNHFLYFFQIVKELLYYLSAKADIQTRRLTYQLSGFNGGG